MPLLRISFIALFLTFPLSSYGNSDNRLALYWEGESLINCAAEAVRIGNKKEMDFYTSAAVQFNLALAMDENSANGHSQAAHDELEADIKSRISTRTKSLIRKYDDEDVMRADYGKRCVYGPIRERASYYATPEKITRPRTVPLQFPNLDG